MAFSSLADELDLGLELDGPGPGSFGGEGLGVGLSLADELLDGPEDLGDLERGEFLTTALPLPPISTSLSPFATHTLTRPPAST